MRRIFLDHAPDRELRERAAQEHRGRDAADRDQRDARADPLVDDLGQRDGHGVEHQARGGADQDEQPEHRDHHPHRQPHVRRGAAAGGELAVVRHHHEIGDAGRDADHSRHEERAAPADPCGQRRGDAGGERDADIAADAVEGQRAARGWPRLRSGSRCRPDDRSRRTRRARTARPRAR